MITRFKKEPGVIGTDEIQAWKEFRWFKIIWRPYESEESPSSFSLIPPITRGYKELAKNLPASRFIFLQSMFPKLCVHWMKDYD